jgi:hypothetical protein
VRGTYPARLFFQLCMIVAVLVVTSCSPSPDRLSAVDKQRLNRALTYFFYSQADRQLQRMPPGLFSPKNNQFQAQRWVVAGLRVPSRLITHEKIGGHAGFEVGYEQIGVSGGGEWEAWFVKNPQAEFSTTAIQLFDDAPAIWDMREHLWHLPPEYHDDYEWARNQDRFKFFLPFYQDPFPATTR